MRTKISSVGVYSPDRILSNKDLEKILDTDDNWITKRTGIKRRRIGRKDETNQTMAAEAAKNAIANYNGKFPTIEYIIVATNTNEKNFPNAAMYVQKELRKFNDGCILPNAGGHDTSAGCAGINVALQEADALIRSEMYDNVLVVGSDKLSFVTDYSDRGTAVLFGDGASAYVLNSIDEKDSGFLGHYSFGDGFGQNYLTCEENQDKVNIFEAFSAVEDGREPLIEKGKVLKMDGKEVYEFVISNLCELVENFKDNKKLNPLGLDFEDLNAVIPHQANLRMFKAIDRKCPGFMEKCMVTIEDYGNTSTASQGVSYREFLENAKEGDTALSVGYGSGLMFSSNLYKVC
jgi:3-oxoacyl-[acyl-carrier-protein] synthase-3